MRLVLVEWVDAISNSGWHSPKKELCEVSSCVTVGFLLYDEEDIITIAQNINITSGNIGDTISIPKGCVKRVRTLKVK